MLQFRAHAHTRTAARAHVSVCILLKCAIPFGTAVRMMSDYTDYYEQCSFYGGPKHCPGYMYGYQDYYATQGRGPFGEPLRDLPDQEYGVELTNQNLFNLMTVKRRQAI